MSPTLSGLVYRATVCEITGLLARSEMLQRPFISRILAFLGGLPQNPPLHDHRTYRGGSNEASFVHNAGAYQRHANLCGVRVLLVAAALFASACLATEQPRHWLSGKVTPVEHSGEAYDYSVFGGGCGLVGHAVKKLRLEPIRFYGPAKVVDALAAILNQITGKSFGFIYNGGTEAERTSSVRGWHDFLIRTSLPKLCDAG